MLQCKNHTICYTDRHQEGKCCDGPAAADQEDIWRRSSSLEMDKDRKVH